MSSQTPTTPPTSPTVTIPVTSTVNLTPSTPPSAASVTVPSSSVPSSTPVPQGTVAATTTPASALGLEKSNYGFYIKIAIGILIAILLVIYFSSKK